MIRGKQRRERKLFLKIKYIGLLITLAGLVFLVSIGIRVVSQRWDGQTQLSVLIRLKEKFILLVADPSKETVFLVDFPENLLIDAFGGYGQFKFRNLNGLAVQEGKPEIFVKSVEYFFGIPVDYWLDYQEKELPKNTADMPKFISGIVRRSIIGGGTITGGENKLNIYLLSGFLKNRHLYWQYKNMTDLGLVVDGAEDDLGSDYILNLDAWDKWSQTYLSDLSLKEEGYSLGIYNTTYEKGLAFQTARIFSNSGFWVVKVGNDENDEKNCRIEVKANNQLNTKSLKRIKKIVNCPVETVDEKSFPDFTDINLYLGDEYLSELKKST